MAERAIDIKILKLSPENFAELLALVYSEKINANNYHCLAGRGFWRGLEADQESGAIAGCEFCGMPVRG